MNLYFKNMVCNRCKMIVQSELHSMKLHIMNIELGEVEIQEELSAGDKQKLSQKLAVYGFSLIDDKKVRTIEKIKTLLVNLVQEQKGKLKMNLSEYN